MDWAHAPHLGIMFSWKNTCSLTTLTNLSKYSAYCPGSYALNLALHNFVIVKPWYAQLSPPATSYALGNLYYLAIAFAGRMIVPSILAAIVSLKPCSLYIVTAPNSLPINTCRTHYQRSRVKRNPLSGNPLSYLPCLQPDNRFRLFITPPPVMFDRPLTR